MKILFLFFCNTCRSVLAHYYAAHLAAGLKLPHKFTSAGLEAHKDIPQPKIVADLLAKEATRRRKLDGGLYLVGVQPDLCDMLKRSGQVDTVGEQQIFGHKGDAIQAIYPRLDNEICRHCSARIFRECQAELPDGTAREA